MTSFVKLFDPTNEDSRVIERLRKQIESMQIIGDDLVVGLSSVPDEQWRREVMRRWEQAKGMK